MKMVRKSRTNNIFKKSNKPKQAKENVICHRIVPLAPTASVETGAYVTSPALKAPLKENPSDTSSDLRRGPEAPANAAGRPSWPSPPVGPTGQVFNTAPIANVICSKRIRGSSKLKNSDDASSNIPTPAIHVKKRENRNQSVELGI
ncbi:hypothetical protein ONE63_011124 [Megalurothrips usitatus]|uniref:Uncharacterized protein n=1 Tax=Megalurothrips usitatus TaxID=439358 RepID=A0AAV7XF39_9NEOP|nr:hypothetical protein ONE63_011124 [Megalurothrips usitatus]